MENPEQTRLKPGERIDQIAMRVFGDPKRYAWLIADNPGISIFYPVTEKLLRVNRARR